MCLGVAPEEPFEFGFCSVEKTDKDEEEEAEIRFDKKRGDCLRRRFPSEVKGVGRPKRKTFSALRYHLPLLCLIFFSSSADFKLCSAPRLRVSD